MDICRRIPAGGSLRAFIGVTDRNAGVSIGFRFGETEDELDTEPPARSEVPTLE